MYISLFEGTEILTFYEEHLLQDLNLFSSFFLYFEGCPKPKLVQKFDSELTYQTKEPWIGFTVNYFEVFIWHCTWYAWNRGFDSRPKLILLPHVCDFHSWVHAHSAPSTARSFQIRMFHSSFFSLFILLQEDTCQKRNHSTCSFHNTVHRIWIEMVCRWFEI